MAKLFTSGPHNTGRPRGSKNRIAQQVYSDVLAHWSEPVTPGHERTKGQAALQMTFKLDPARYLSFVGSLLPKELAIETVTGDLDDNQIDLLIANIKERLLAKRAEEPILIEAREKVDAS